MLHLIFTPDGFSRCCKVASIKDVLVLMASMSIEEQITDHIPVVISPWSQLEVSALEGVEADASKKISMASLVQLTTRAEQVVSWY